MELPLNVVTPVPVVARESKRLVTPTVPWMLMAPALPAVRVRPLLLLPGAALTVPPRVMPPLEASRVVVLLTVTFWP